MKKVLFFLFLCIIFNFNNLAFAQIKLNEYRSNLNVKPGETVRGSIIVKNSSNETIVVKGYLEDFTYLSPFDGVKDFKKAGSLPSSLSEWITITPALLTIPAKGNQQVNYSIKVPAEAKGGYCGVIFFEKTSSGVSGSGVGVVLRVGYNIILNTKDSVKEIKIKNVAVFGNTIKAELLNSGTAILVSEPDYNVLDAKGMILDRGKLEIFALPPEGKVPLKIVLSEKIPDGKHTLLVNVNLGAAGLIMKEIDFSKDKTAGVKVLSVKD